MNWIYKKDKKAPEDGETYLFWYGEDMYAVGFWQKWPGRFECPECGNEISTDYLAWATITHPKEN